MSECSGFDPDRFGYFDLVEKLNKLGFDSWDRLSFKKKWEVEQIDIKGDAEVVLMLKFLTAVRTQVCDVYVVGGKKGGLEQIVEDKSFGGEMVWLILWVMELLKHRVVEFELVRMSNFESVSKSKCITKSRKETTSKAGKLKTVATQNIVEKSVENSVKKSLFQSSQKSVVESVGKSVGDRKSAAKDVGDGKSAAKDVGVDKSPHKRTLTIRVDNLNESPFWNVMTARVIESPRVIEGSNRDGALSVFVGMGDRPDESVGDKPDESVGVGMVYDSEDDGSYIPSSKDEETDDDMETEELFSEDEEYKHGRKKAKEKKRKKEFVVTNDMFYGLVSGGQTSEYVSEYENSEEDDIYSDSTDSQDEGRRKMERHAKVMYDPRCDHKHLKLCIGMGFIDDFQATDALTVNAVDNGWEIDML